MGQGQTPPMLGKLKDFGLWDQDKQKFGATQLRGKIWIANFIFTRCTATCPAQTAQMASIQAQLKEHKAWSSVRLVSITVDPSFDTHQVLKSYSEGVGADQASWKFLTGSIAGIRDLCGQFRLPVGDGQNTASDSTLVTHSSKFVLVDGEGNIRGYYQGTSESSCQKLVRDLNLLLAPQRELQTQPNARSK